MAKKKNAKNAKNATSLRVMPGFGGRIAAARKDAGLSQATLAAAVGHNQAWLQKIENDERALLTIDLVAIALAIGVTMESLVPMGSKDFDGGDDETQKEKRLKEPAK